MEWMHACMYAWNALNFFGFKSEGLPKINSSTCFNTAMAFCIPR